MNDLEKQLVTLIREEYDKRSSQYAIYPDEMAAAILERLEHLDHDKVTPPIAYRLIETARNGHNDFARIMAAREIMDRTEGKALLRIEKHEEIDEKTAMLILQLEKEIG